MHKVIFVSSVQREFAEERKAIRDFVRADSLLGKHFDVFLFEDQPAQSRGPAEIYVTEVDSCAVYIGLLGTEYGFEDYDGISATEREFDRAVARRKQRLIFIKSGSEISRNPKQKAFVQKVESQLKRSKFAGITDLTGQIYSSLIRVLEQDRVLVSRPFDSQFSSATLKDIDPKRVLSFRQLAATVRQSRLGSVSSVPDVLRHLNLTDGTSPNNSAVLLFGRRPTAIIPSAETKCLSYFGVVPERPALSYQKFDTPLPDQIEAAIEFVMSRLNRSVGIRDQSATVPGSYEIARAAVAEAIVNAIAHRDYTAASAVQVSVFSDRVEVSNPGELPQGLTPQQLRQAHPSIPKNPLIRELLFLSGYIEKAGTGTTEIIRQCLHAGLGEPRFEQVGDQWVVTLWRDWLTPSFIANHDLNQRQAAGLQILRQFAGITNSTYRTAAKTTAKTAARDLDDLVQKGVLTREGSGRGVRYVRSRQ